MSLFDNCNTSMCSMNNGNGSNFCNTGAPSNPVTPPQDGSYQNFKIANTPESNYNLNGGHLHVMVEQFGQGVLLNHDLSTRQVQVQLARTGDIVVLPGSAITLHVQHRVLSFEEFMMEEMAKMNAQSACNAGNGGAGGQSQVAKRERGGDEMTYSSCRPNGPNAHNFCG